VRVKVRQLSGEGTLYAGVVTYDSAGHLLTNPHGMTYAYNAASGVRLTPEMGWQTFEGTISGTTAIVAGANRNKFFEGSASAVPLLLYNYAGDVSGDNSRLVEVDSLELVDTATGQVLNLNAQTEAGGTNWSRTPYSVNVDGASSLNASQVKALLHPDSQNDRTTRYVYDAVGRQRYVIDALGNVSENKYDANGRLIETLRYNKAINPDSVSNERDVQLALNALWSQDFSAGTSGLNMAGAGTTIRNEAGRMVLENQTGTSWPSIAENAYRPYDAGLLYRTELTSPSLAAGRFIIGINNGKSGAALRTHHIALVNGVFSAYGSKPDGTNATLATLGTAKLSTTYVMELETTDTGTLLYVYEKGKERSSGWQHSLAFSATEWGQVRWVAYAVQGSYGAATEAYLDNLSVSDTTQTPAANAQRTRYVYNAAGQLTSVTDAAGKVESYTYDALGNRKTLKNKNGAVCTYHYDSLNRLVEEVAPAVLVASISVDGVVSTATRYLVTSIGYDAFGNVISREEGRQRATGLADDLSQARITTYAYDALGRQIKTTAPGWYNKLTGQYQQVADATTPANTFQVSTDVTYDALGNAVRNRVRINNTGVVASDFVDSFKVYDALGRVSHEVDALKGVTTYDYDALGNATRTTRYANALTKAVPALGYYLKADITAATLIPDASFDRTLTTSYDALGRKTAVQQNSVGIYSFNGNVATSSLLTAAPTTLYSYDALGQLVRETQVARNTSGVTVLTGASTVYYYDRSGQRIGTVDALGHYTLMEYDGLGQLSRQVEYTTKLASWNENSLPSAPAANGADRSTLYAYDAMGRVTQTTRENVLYWQQDASNLNGVVTATEVRGNVIESRLTYDNVGNTKTITDALGNVTTTEYNALGQVTKLIEPARWTAKAGAVNPLAADYSGLMMASPTVSYLLNAFGQIIREIRAAGSDAASNVQAGLSQTTRTRYDAAGYEIQEIDAAGSAQTYKVDVAGRRIEESRQINVTLSAWTVDGAALTRNQTLRRTFEYDRLGQQLASTDWYTAANNTQQASRTAATYNRFGEVTLKQLNGGTVEILNYDQVGRLESIGNANGATVFNYDLSGKVSRSTGLGDWSTAADDRISYMRNDLLGRTLEQHLPAFEANTNADTLNSLTLTLTTPIIRQTHDRWGNVLSRTDARGQTSHYSYNHNNQLNDESLPATDILRENGTSYRSMLLHKRGYDAVGNLIQEQDYLWPYAGVSNFTLLRTRQHVYNQVGELNRDIDALGYTRAYMTDAHGNRVATRDALGTVLVDSYDAMDRHTSHGIVRNGAKVTLLTNQYDQAGRLYGEINGASAIEETLTSTAANNATLTSIVSGLAGNTRYTLFDERGLVVKTRNESKVEKRYEFDGANRKTKEIDGLNNTLTWTYNAADFGRLTSRKDLGGRVYSFTYNDFGQVEKESLQVPPIAGSTTWTTGADKTYSYYGNGLTKAIVESSAETRMESGYTTKTENTQTSTYQYDQAGNKVREINSARDYWDFGGGYISDQISSAESRYKFDEQGRLKEVKAPAGKQLVGAAL